MKNTINTIFILIVAISGSNTAYGMEPEKKPILTLSIISSENVNNPREISISALPNFANLVGEAGLTTIYNELITQNQRIVTAAQKDFIAGIDPIISIYFGAQSKPGTNIVNHRLDFERKNIASSEAKSSTLEKLQHCLYKKDTNELETIQHIKKMQTPSNKSSRTPYFIAAGLGILLLFFVAHQLKLLPTELPNYFRAYPKIPVMLKSL